MNIQKKLITFLGDGTTANKSETVISLAEAEGLWVVASVCQLLKLPFNAQVVRTTTAFPLSADSLHRTLKELGVTTRQCSVSFENLQRAGALSSLVFLHAESPPVGQMSGSSGTDGSGSESVPSNVIPITASHKDAAEAPAPVLADTQIIPAIVIGAKDGKVLLALCGKCAKPEMMTFDEMTARLSSQSIWSLSRLEKLPQQEQEGFGWRWFLNSFLSHKALIRNVLLTSLVVQLIGLGTPLATQAIVDKVISNQAVNTLLVLGVGIGVFALFSAALSWIRQSFLLHIANRMDGELAVSVFRHLFRLPLQFFEQRATGVLINRVHGVEQIREFMSGAFLTLVLELPFLLIFLGIMLYYSLVLSALVLSIVAAMTALSFVAGPILRQRAMQQYQLGAKGQGFMTEYVSAMESVKSLQMEPGIERRFTQLNQAYLDAVMCTRTFGNSYGTLMNLMEQLMNVSVLCLGAYVSMTSPDFTLGMLIAFQMFASRVSQPLIKMSGLWQEFQQTRIAVMQLSDIMNMPAEPYSALPGAPNTGPGLVQMKGVSFRYSQDRPFLYSNLGLTLESGKCTVLVGPSGSGKSTLAKILQGIIMSYEGQVTIDGRDIRSMATNELRQYFGVIPQETVLFSGTVFENLLSGAPAASMEQVVAACQMAGIHDAIQAMPKGYQTELGERGVGLSGGQKQRISIARALLKRPKILVFDEATSSLDKISADCIGETVNNLQGKATVLFIAHQVPDTLKFDVRVDLGQSLVVNY